MDAKRLLEIENELRRMISTLDESEAERNIAAAIVYIDCARLNVTAQQTGAVDGAYAVRPQVVVCSSPRN
jgi:hypothetical protein